jgi:hypothetical protein
LLVASIELLQEIQQQIIKLQIDKLPLLYGKHGFYEKLKDSKDKSQILTKQDSVPKSIPKYSPLLVPLNLDISYSPNSFSSPIQTKSNLEKSSFEAWMPSPTDKKKQYFNFN